MVHEVALLVFMAGYSFAITHFIPQRWYSYSNIVLALGCVGFGLVTGLTWEQMGLSVGHVVSGLLWGLAVALPIVVAVTALAVFPRTAHFFSDAPSKHASVKAASYQLGFRIPFGTALSEEVLFRGVLLGLLLQNHSVWVALVISSVAFGLWHVLPTLQTLRTNEAVKSMLGDKKHRHGLALTAPVLVTSLAGVGFGWLRLVSGSVLAPWIVHVTSNTASYAGGYITLLIRRKRQGTNGTIEV
jgi:membrane protease YdiL (CAAX protease family)